MLIRVNWNKTTGDIDSIKHCYDPDEGINSLHIAANRKGDGRLVASGDVDKKTMAKIFEKLNIEMPEIIFE